MDTAMLIEQATLLGLLQLASSALPVGAYSYSEGLETLTEAGKVHDVVSLRHWLEQELQYGAIRLEAAVMLRAYNAARVVDEQALNDWNSWLSAAKETEELRDQSQQMGRALTRLLQDIQPQSLTHTWHRPCNFAIAFGLAAANWQINSEAAILGYLHSWVTGLINAGVKLIPLGQTAGQRLLLDLHPSLSQATQEILELDDDDLYSCGWGLALVSMAHETQYTRLFRS